MDLYRNKIKLEARSVRESPRTVIVAIYRGEMYMKAESRLLILRQSCNLQHMSFRKNQVIYQSNHAKG